MVKYIDKYILKDPLCDQHKGLCQQYRKEKTMEEVEMLYQGIRAWKASAKVIFDSTLSHLEL